MGIRPRSGKPLDFLVDPDLVSAGGNDVWLRNPNMTDSDIEVELFFSMGDVAVEIEPAIVPALSQWSLIAIALFLLASASVLLVWRNRSAAGSASMPGR